MEGCARIVYFAVLVILGLIDIVSDWLLCSDVLRSAYDYEDAVKYSLLAFSIFGTVWFLIEVVNLGGDVFRENACADVDLVSAVAIWVGDLPQIVINFDISYSGEEPVSVYQLIKAGVLFGVLVFRIGFLLVNYCLKNAQCRDNKCRRRKFFRVMVMFGLIINATLASFVFYFAYTRHDS